MIIDNSGAGTPMEHVRHHRNGVRLHAILFAGMALTTLAGIIVMISILGQRS